MPSIVNIAAYKFAELKNLPELRDELRNLSKVERLRGTILLSPEGINLFVAGSRNGINTLLMRLREIPAIADIAVKVSYSEDLPFNRMLVKIKSEIIAFGVAGIDPRQYTSRRISAHELKSWLDEGRPVTLLDTRNNFEVQTGTFRNAVAIDIEDFRDFPAAVRRLPDEMKTRPIITFCTGGIRCEKATPYLEREGFQNVYQLDGGILKYFEECGGAHYHGQCFVFDKRVALDQDLLETDLQNCFACRAVLTADDLESPKYVEGQSCPHCYLTQAESQARLIEARQAAIRQAANPLPGSVPYDNVRPISVPLRFDGFELLDFLDAMQTHLSREAWVQSCTEGRLICRGETVQPGRLMRAGDRLLHTQPAEREPDVATEIEILYEDDAIVVINKPAPLPMHPCGRFNRNSLAHLLNQTYHPLKLRPAHRLDADTSGVVVFCKSREMARLVQPQFEAGHVNKTYLARVHGKPNESDFEADWAINAEPGPGGIRLPDVNGVAARTQFRVLKHLDDGTTLLEIRPLTGRTNQIRAHLWKLGLPIVGDPIYLRDGQLGTGQTLSKTDPRLCLHAMSIEFVHPFTNQRTRYAAAPPEWQPAGPVSSCVSASAVST
ncbi:MAG: rluA [Planctomycetaceae bacterium]|nr:rluA [Planctomycetaceae bacterium]